MADQGPALLGSSRTFFGITAVVVCTSLLVRSGLWPRRQTRASKLGLDDAIALISLLVFLTTNIILTIAVSYGLGKSIDDIPSAERSRAIYWNLVLISTIIFNFCISKFAFAAFVGRLRAGTTTWLSRWWTWVLCTISLLFIFAVSVWEWKQCHPVSFQWNPVPGTGSCSSPNITIGLAVSSSIFSAVVDVVLVLWSVVIIWRLKTSLSVKLANSIPLVVGAAACAVSILKIVLLSNGLEKVATDPTAAMSTQYMLVNAEAAALLISARITLLHPLCPPLHRIITGQSKNSGYPARSSRAARAFRSETGKSKTSELPKGEDEMELTRQESDAQSVVRTEARVSDGASRDQSSTRG